MRHCIGSYVAGMGLVLLSAMPAWGAPTFSYTTDFESDADGATPAGWIVANSGDTPFSAGPSLDPKVMAADPANWETRSQLGAAGVVNYAVPWSGNGTTGHRFTILHPGWSTNDTLAWATGAMFTGPGATYTGTYPMNLQNNSFKAVFDLAVRTANRPTSTHGFTFVVQPVADAQHVRVVGEAYGREGYDMNGFSVEVDVYQNTGGAGSGSGDQDNKHVGVNLYRIWDITGAAGGGITVPSLKTNVDQGVAVPFPAVADLGGQSVWCSVGNNNQPLHFTVYYNDPAKGGPGVVRVYLKVDPATKAAGDPPVPSGQTPFSFGYDTGDDPVDGKLMVEVCVGAWPATGAVFGFTAARSGSSHIAQVDNVHVETNAADTSSPCTVSYPDGSPTYDGGTSADLSVPPSSYNPSWNAMPIAATPAAAGLSTPGWDVTSYLMYPADSAGTFTAPMDVFKASIRYQQDSGWNLGNALGEPAVNYWDAGGIGGVYTQNGNLGDDRVPPGTGTNMHWYGILAKGYIYFPVGDHDYNLCVNSDNGYELKIGGQLVSTNPSDGVFSAALNGGSYVNLHVTTAGVYPIQLLWQERWGGAYVEFYRRTDNPMTPYLLVGNTSWGIADQPVIYSLSNGSRAPDDVNTYSPLPLPSITLSPTQKLAGTGTGQQVFSIKTVQVSYPNIGIQNQYEDDYRQVGLGFLEVLDNRAPGATSATVNFQGAGEWFGALGTGSTFPGVNTASGNYALRAEGFATFPTPGMYFLGLDADDDMYLRFGDQTVINSVCCNDHVVWLNVPEAGTYPVRVEMVAAGAPNRVAFFEAVNGTIVPVNSPASRVKVWQSLSSGAYTWPSSSQAVPIPPSRKVAEVGQGGTLGWDAIGIKPPTGMSFEGYPGGGPMGVATGILENDLVGLGTLLPVPVATATPLSINVELGGEFTAASAAPQNIADDPLSMFQLPGGGGSLFTTGGAGENNFALGFRGYIEFPVAGYYAFNTNTDDGSYLWVAGEVATRFAQYSGAGDNTPGFVYVAQPGIYDARVDYFEGGGDNEVEIVQYLPDGATRLLINDPNSNPSSMRVKVYRTLAVAPLTTAYRNLVRLPLSAKVAEINKGGNPGARFQIVQATFADGNGNDGGIGQDKFKTVVEAQQLLASVLDGVPSLSHPGTLVSDTIVSSVNWSEPAESTGYKGTRSTGLIGLTAGGHVLDVNSDDGFTFSMADRTLGQSGSQHGAYDMTFYVWAPADGLYPFKIEHIGGGPPNQIVFSELVFSGAAYTIEPVNTGNAARMFADLAPCGTPWADIDGDQDVDMDDFGVFQSCFTGDAVESLGWPCGCFDRTGAGAFDGKINATDYATFLNCWTGPKVLWSASTLCPE